MDDRTRFTESLRETLRGFVGSEQYRAHYPAQRIYPDFDPALIQEMAFLSFEMDESHFLRHTEKMLAACIDLEQFLVQAITGAAAILGEWWAGDRISYRVVELGSDRLLDLVYEIADQRLKLNIMPTLPHKIVLSSPQHSKHSLGLAVMGEIFHWHGWNVMAGPSIQHEKLPELVQVEWVDVLGLSLADDRDLRAITELIAQCRLLSRNRHLWVMVGGPQAFLRPQLAAEVGADASCTHASQAQVMALSRVRLQQQSLMRATENRG